MNRPAKHSKELAGAIAEDSRRQAIDDAKKRAVSQHADYDTFKKLVGDCFVSSRLQSVSRCLQNGTVLTWSAAAVQVSVAHLKPLHAPSAGSQGEKRFGYAGLTICHPCMLDCAMLNQHTAVLASAMATVPL